MSYEIHICLKERKKEAKKERKPIICIIVL